MGDMMTFPNTVEEFMEQYKIVDDEKVYTNGADLVPIFRMMQWFEHVSATDTISRQAAIDTLKGLIANGTNRGMISGEDAVHRIEMLPFAQPEQRTGKWIVPSQVPDMVRGYWAKCSACGHSTFGGGRFCRECGAKMEGVTDANTKI